MKRWTSIVLVVLALAFAFPHPSAAQSEVESKRKVTNRVIPEYPDMARRMNLRGVVKVDVLVASNGVVKNVELKGGHPVLAQAALTAVRKWRWETATHDTKEPIEVRFDPQ
jgi:TonB family protein